MPRTKESHAKYMREYRQRNLEKIREYERAQGRKKYYKDIEKSRENARVVAARWRQNNPDRAKEVYRNYAANNPEACKESKRKWLAKNPGWQAEQSRKQRVKNIGNDKYLELMKRSRAKWARENPECLRKNRRDHYARKRGAAGNYTVEQLLARYAFWGWRCRYCQCELTRETVTADHMIPPARGGSNWPSNLVPCCRPCNTRKGQKTFKEFTP